MGDANTGGLQGVQNELVTAAPQQAPPPGAPPVPLPSTGPVTVTGPPPDYKELGAGQAQADFAAASANGGWEFDPEAMDKVIKALDTSINDDYRTARDEAVWLTQVKPPGDEVGSKGYTAVANSSGAEYQKFLAGAALYTSAYRDKLIEIRNAYQNRDQAAIDSLRGIRKA